MSRLKQYLVFGGAVFLVQTDFVQGVLQGSSFYTVLFSFIGVMLAAAVGLTLYYRKRL